MSELIAGIVGAVVGAIVGSVVTFALDGIKSHRMQKKNEELEAALRQVQRRGEAPFLSPTSEDFVQLYCRDGNEIRMVHYGAPHLLCGSRYEVDKKTSAGTPVFLVVQNTGQAARRVRAEMDGERIVLEEEPEFEGAKGRYFFRYPYVPSKHGSEQILKLTFETSSGVQDTHTYRTVHGARVLERTDPK